MVKVGNIVTGVTSQITSHGDGGNDGWSTFGQFKGSDMPGAPAHFVVIMWCEIGMFVERVTGSATQPNNAIVEVGLRIVTAAGGPQPVSPLFRHRVALTWGDLQKATISTMPVGFVFDTVNWIFRQWTATDTLEFVARIDRNGDAKTVNGSFQVLQWWGMAWNKDRLTPGEFFYDHYTPINARFNFNNPNAVATPNYRLFRSFGQPGGLNDTWLIFSGIGYYPVHPTLPPWWNIHEDPAGTAENWILGNTGWGQVPRGKPGVKMGRRDGQDQHHQLLGMAVHTLKGETRNFLLRGSERHNTGQNSAVRTWFTFGVNLTEMSFPAFARSALGKYPPDPIAGAPIFPGSTTVEFSNSRYSDYVLLVSAAPRWFSQRSLRYSIRLVLDEGTLVCGNFLWQQWMKREFAGSVLAGINKNHKKGVVETAIKGTALPPAPTLLAEDAQIVGFYFENDPENIDFPPEIPGPELVIIPDREVVDASALTTPPFEPSWKIEMEEVENWFKWTADDGTPITWPRFLKGRRMFSFQWPGLTATEVETMLAWADALKENAWKWTHPDEGPPPLVFRFMGKVSATSKGIIYRVGPVRALELVFIGGAP